MQEKNEFINNSIYILNQIYKEKININNNEYYEINIDNKVDIIKTKLEFKKYIRNIISSKNKNLRNDIIEIINIRYGLIDSKLKTFNEIFPNIDIFIATYIKFKNENMKIDIEEYDYETLFEYLITTYINTSKQKENEKVYESMTSNEKSLNKEINELENSLKKYQIVKKNKFYYETYKTSLLYENEIYSEDKLILETNIDNLNNNIKESKQELDKLLNSKKITKKKQEKINKLKLEIEFLNNEQLTLLKEVEKLSKQNSINIKKNDLSFEKYIDDISLEDFEKYYSELKDINAKELLDKINSKKTELNKIIDNLAKSKYPKEHLILKYFCIDNLKILNRKTDMNPKLINKISKLLEENTK